MDRGGDYSDHNHNSHPTSSWSFDDPVHLHHQNGRHHHHNHGSQQNDSIGRKRHFSPGYADGSTPAKLYVAGVPRTVTEQDIRSLFGEHGNIVEVIPLKDKRTGLQQECCFVKYTKFEEADRAIAVLNNQYTFYGGMLPIKVRYADGERRRQVTEDSGGIWASKLYVGCVNKKALIREIEEIFSPYGLVEDVYIMRDELRQSRGCAFVQFSHRDMAVGAINGLNGVYVMRGCDQPLIVRFADPKKPKTGESRPVSYAPAGPSNADSSDPLDCDWSEHICPDGYKYYYNCVTCESRWEKPEEYSFYEQEVRNGPQQQNPRRQQLNSPSFSQTQLSHQEPQKPSLAVQGLDHVHAQASTSSVVSPTCG